MQTYDVIIVGAGPAGLMAAYELTKRFGKSISIDILDKGDSIEKRVCFYSEGTWDHCHNCDPCGIANGVMGAGLRSDGKMHFHKDVMELYRMGLFDEKEIDAGLNYIEGCFEKWGMAGPVYPILSTQARDLSDKVAELGLADNFELKVKQRTRHIGSDRLPNLAQNMIRDIHSLGNVELHTRAEMTDYAIADDQITGIKFKEKNGHQQYSAKKVLIGLGRKGSPYVQKMIEELGIPHSYRPVEIGGRVEVPSHIMKSITDAIYNPCFRQKRNGLATFTFCTNPDGNLTTESLLPGIVGINGESRASEKSGYTNFAILTEVPLPPGVNPNKRIIELLREKFQGSAPYVQTTRDFVEGTTRDKDNHPKGTLNGKVYADISQLFLYEITEQLRDFLMKLNKVCPGVISDQSLFIAPEAKIRGMRVLPSNKSLETNIQGLYLIGDSSGLSANISAAALTGLMVARNINIEL